MERRMNYVDMARGVAIILVMAGHSILFPACGAIHIPTFFVLTGFVITMKSLGNNTFEGCMKKRVLRLIYPYAFYSILLFLLKTIKDIASGSFIFMESVKDIFGILYSSTFIFKGGGDKFLCFRVGNEGLWFLTAMISACAVFYLLVYKIFKLKYNYIMIAAAAIALTCIGRLLEMLPFYLPWGLDIAFIGVVFMLFGMMLREPENVFQNKKTTGLIMIAGGVGFLIINALNGEANMAIHLYGQSRWLFILSGFCSSLFIIGACRILEGVGFVEKALSYVGRNTLFILAFHTMVFGIYDKLFETAGVEFTGLWIARLILSLMTCLAGQLFCEKVLRIPRKFL